MTAKTKVKDLAAELGLSNKDILQKLRDIGVQVKSHMSTLEDEDVARLRSAAGVSPVEKVTTVVRREVQPGVIVRRRRAVPATESAAETDAKKAESKAPRAKTRATAKAEPAEEAPASEKKAAPKPARAKTKTETEEAPEAKAQPAPEAKPKPAPKPEPKKEEPKARIISMPRPAAEEAPEAKARPAEPAPSGQPEAKPRPEARPAPSEPAPSTPEETAVTGSPAPAEAKEAAAGPADAKTEAQEPAVPGQAAPDQAAAEAEGEKRKKKPKREVIVPQVRVISRPDPSLQAERQDRFQRPERQEYRGERPERPAGYGDRPQGPGGPRPGGYAPRPGGYGDRPQGPGGPRPGGYGDRPQGPGGPRPGGYAPRPGGFGDRPGGPRPGGPAGRPMRPDAPASPTSEGERKRKPQKKDRRVVNFGAGTSEGAREAEDLRKAAAGFDPKRRDLMTDDGSYRPRRRRKPKQAKEVRPEPAQPMKAAKRKIRVDETIRVGDLAKQMGVKAPELIKVLFGMGVMATINQALDMDTATLLASEFGYEVENVTFDEQDLIETSGPDMEEDLKPRPPVVTIMGHVDHGKTSLLDSIRLTNVTAGEAGGITQHIGAYHVATNRGEVVFLDTPGHEAFTTMRARGAQVTDIVILVVAADDGVMDQTKEAINHAKAAGVPIVVAVNKIDKEGANPDRVRRELADQGLVPEDWGGETIFAHVSAKQRIGLDELLEMVLLQAEVLELKANPVKPARGHIIEAKLDKGRGPIGTLLVREGTIKLGDAFVCGIQSGRVRAMFNDQGKKIKSAGPAMPVEIQGFDGVPEAGDEFVVVADDKVARRIAQSRLNKQRERELAGKTKVTLESFLATKPDQEARVLNLVVKADVQGSLEAIVEAVAKLSTDEVRVNVVHGGAGAITESDIMLATASQAIIIGFNVRPTAKVKEVADQENVEIRFYDIIYKLVSEIKDAMSGMLAPEIQEVYLGQAEVRNTFTVPKVGTVAGCFVMDGKLTRNCKIRLLRDGVVVYTGQLASLRRFKDDAKEVLKGYECGAGLEKFNDVKVGDVIEAFEHKEVARTID